MVNYCCYDLLVQNFLDLPCLHDDRLGGCMSNTHDLLYRFKICQVCAFVAHDVLFLPDTFVHAYKPGGIIR